MEPTTDGLHWYKSSSSAAGNCVEIAHLPQGGVALRDSKNPARQPHTYTRTEWDAFLTGAKNGEFNIPA